MFCICCTEQEQPTTPSLKVDIENIIKLPVDTTRIIHIETNDSSLLYDVCLVEKIDNNNNETNEIILIFFFILFSFIIFIFVSLINYF